MLVKVVSVEDGTVTYSAAVPFNILVPDPLIATSLIS